MYSLWLERRLLVINSKKIVRKLTRGKGNVLAFSPAEVSLQEKQKRTWDGKSKLIWDRKKRRGVGGRVNEKVWKKTI